MIENKVKWLYLLAIKHTCASLKRKIMSKCYVYLDFLFVKSKQINVLCWYGLIFFCCRKCAMNVVYIIHVDVITFVSLPTFFKNHRACILFWSNISGFRVSWYLVSLEHARHFQSAVFQSFRNQIDLKIRK